MRRHGRALALATVLTLVVGIMSVVATASAQVTVPVTVTISRVQALQDPDPAPLQGQADMYGRVTIDGFSQQQVAEISNDADIEPFWTFTRNVDVAFSPIPITIEVLDADSGLAAPDDEIDLNPVDAKTALTLILDLNTGNWTFGGDPIANNATSATGDGDTEHSGIFEGGEQGRIFFDISILSASGDADGDGLLDGWETDGLDFDGDGTIDVDLPAFGADPNHKDLFLELDIEAGQAPNREDIQAMKAAFAAAPLGNPDGNPGVNLWVDTGGLVDMLVREGAPLGTCLDGLDNGVDGQTDAADPDCSNTPGNRNYLEVSVEDPQPGNCNDAADNDGDTLVDGADPDCLVGDNLGGGGIIGATGACNLDANFFAAKAANFNANRAWVFRYAVAANLGGCPSSGGWGEIGGNDFIDFNHDGGTLLHEFGHNLNLQHGGNVDTNCKPNYVSVMDYDEQFGIQRVGGGGILDYSPPRIAFNGSTRGAALPQLVENNLNDGLVLDGTDNANRYVFTDAANAKVQFNLNAGANWNSDADPPLELGQTVNINDDGAGGSPPACNNASSSETLNFSNDWNQVSLPFRQFGDSATGAIRLVDTPSPTLDDFDVMIEALNTTDLSITKTDDVDPAVAGTSLTYTLTVMNHGPNPASSVEVVDTLPVDVSFDSAPGSCAEASGVVTCNLGEILSGAEVSFDVTVDIPADLVFNNGGPKTITNTVEVANLLGPDSNPANNSDSENTLVVAVADLEIVSYGVVTPPAEIVVGEDVEVTIRKVITNNGPSAPMDTELTPMATSSSGTTVTPISVVTAEPALELDEQREVLETYRLSCQEESTHQFTFSNEIQPLLPADTDTNQTNNTATFDLDVECVVPVQINIHPGSDPNSINPGKGTVTVVILTTDAGEYGLPLGFDATTIDPLSVRFGSRDVVFDETGGAFERHNRGHLEDSLELDEVTNDGDTDMVLHFKTSDTGIIAGDTEACVKGEWTDAGGNVHKFFGCDAIRTTPN